MTDRGCVADGFRWFVVIISAFLQTCIKFDPAAQQTLTFKAVHAPPFLQKLSAADRREGFSTALFIWEMSGTSAVQYRSLIIISARTNSTKQVRAPTFSHLNSEAESWDALLPPDQKSTIKGCFHGNTAFWCFLAFFTDSKHNCVPAFP